MRAKQCQQVFAISKILVRNSVNMNDFVCWRNAIGRLGGDCYSASEYEIMKIIKGKARTDADPGGW
jgi:hypothetical protein